MSANKLQIINGIGPKYAHLLYDGGITSVEDIASSTPEALAEIVQAPEWRAHYADWIQQAKIRTGMAPDEQPENIREQGILTDEGMVTLDREELEELLADLNKLTEALQQLSPDNLPPPYAPMRVRTLLKAQTDRITPEVLRTLQESMDSMTLEDFKDPETWKGMLYTLNYLAKLEATERSGKLLQCLSTLPGAESIVGVKAMLADTPPEEFLKLDTWKGILFIINHELQTQVQGIKNRAVVQEDGK